MFWSEKSVLWKNNICFLLKTVSYYRKEERKEKNCKIENYAILHATYFAQKLSHGVLFCPAKRARTGGYSSETNSAVNRAGGATHKLHAVCGAPVSPRLINNEERSKSMCFALEERWCIFKAEIHVVPPKLNTIFQGRRQRFLPKKDLHTL